jgi:hypothetical protein
MMQATADSVGCLLVAAAEVDPHLAVEGDLRVVVEVVEEKSKKPALLSSNLPTGLSRHYLYASAVCNI